MWYCRRQFISNALLLIGAGCLAGAVLTFWRAVLLGVVLIVLALVIGSKD